MPRPRGAPAAPVLPRWDGDYPDPLALRAEMNTAIDAFLEALLETISPGDILGIYVKGSGLKPWDTPIDYVPSLSDVDIHVHFADAETGQRHFSRLQTGLSISQRAEDLYRDRIRHPIHVPRVQMVFANKLYDDPTFIPSPARTVEVRFGSAEPEREVDLSLSRERAVTSTLENEDYLAKLPEQVADLAGPHLRLALRGMSWRVTPTGPRVLELAGGPFEMAWSSNRTTLVRLLHEAAGKQDLAHAYADFYLAGWRYFLSGDKEGRHARSAILAGSEVLTSAITIARVLAR